MTCIILSAYFSGFLYEYFYEFNEHLLFPKYFVSSFPTSLLWNQPCAEGVGEASVYSFSKHFIKEQSNELIQVMHLTQCLDIASTP